MLTAEYSEELKSQVVREVVEQLVPTGDNQWTSTTTEQDFAAFVDTIAAAITNSRGRPCPVDPTYCERFTTPIT